MGEAEGECVGLYTALLHACAPRYIISPGTGLQPCTHTHTHTQYTHTISSRPVREGSVEEVYLRVRCVLFLESRVEIVMWLRLRLNTIAE